MSTNYVMVTGKKSGKVILQTIMTEDLALNMYRRTILKMQPMEESSADLRAIQTFGKVAAGNPQGLTKGDTTVVFQKHGGPTP